MNASDNPIKLASGEQRGYVINTVCLVCGRVLFLLWSHLLLSLIVLWNQILEGKFVTRQKWNYQELTTLGLTIEKF